MEKIAVTITEGQYAASKKYPIFDLKEILKAEVGHLRKYPPKDMYCMPRRDFREQKKVKLVPIKITISKEDKQYLKRLKSKYKFNTSLYLQHRLDEWCDFLLGGGDHPCLEVVCGHCKTMNSADAIICQNCGQANEKRKQKK